MNKVKGVSVVLAVIVMALLSPYIIPPQPLYVEETEEFEIGGITVDIPSKYVQIPTLRTGLPVRLSMYCSYDSVAAQLAEAIDDPEASTWYRAYLVSEFVGDNIEYRCDRFDDWKLPWETVRDGYGDCEDKAILAQAMLTSMNIDSVLVLTAHHVLVAVNTGETYGYGVWHDGKWYQFMELDGGRTPGTTQVNPVYLTMDSGFNIYQLLMMEVYIVLLILLVSVICGKQTEKERR